MSRYISRKTHQRVSDRDDGMLACYLACLTATYTIGNDKQKRVVGQLVAYITAGRKSLLGSKIRHYETVFVVGSYHADVCHPGYSSNYFALSHNYSLQI